MQSFKSAALSHSPESQHCPWVVIPHQKKTTTWEEKHRANCKAQAKKFFSRNKPFKRLFNPHRSFALGDIDEVAVYHDPAGQTMWLIPDGLNRIGTLKVGGCPVLSFPKFGDAFPLDEPWRPRRRAFNDKLNYNTNPERVENGDCWEVARHYPKVVEFRFFGTGYLVLVFLDMEDVMRS